MAWWEEDESRPPQADHGVGTGPRHQNLPAALIFVINMNMYQIENATKMLQQQ